MAEVRTWGKMWEKYHRFVFYVIMRMMKCGEFKISLTHPRVVEIDRGKGCIISGL